MKKVYFLAPLIALALFIGLYVWSQSGRVERERAREAAVKAELNAKAVAEHETRRVALAEALRLQEQRKKERAEREARDAADRAARDAALEARDAAFRDQERLGRHIERLKRDTAIEQEAVNRLQLDADAARAEKASLENLLPLTRANAAELTRVLQAIADAEAARVKAAAEAAALAAKNKS